MESITDMLNEIFSTLSNLTLEKKFQTLDSHFQGEFIISTQKVPLYFVAIIPLTYPFGEIKFYTKTIMGYPHQIYFNKDYGGALCLNTPFVNNFNSKLNLDIEKLYGWIKKYYENDGEDEHYEYPIYSKISACKLIFQETAEDFNDARFSEVKFGKFNLSILNDDLENKNSPHVALLAHNLGNKSSTWSNLYSNFVEKPLGFWVYIEEEPVIEKKHKITDFNDLIKLFPQGFKDFLFENIAKKEFKIKELKKHKIFSYLAVGYKIPTSNGQYEVHWDLALIFTKYFAKEKINWAVSNNASYDRFFGRGRLCDSIVNSKIIVLGLGAIGSSLCETLVRGGVKDLSISDYDSVDTGNICRSIYTFKNTGYSKVEKLAERLMQISPYVNLSYAKPLMAHIESSQEFVEIKEEINKLDLIIDCTANNEALELINLYDFKNKVIHISITDKSKQMLCISNDYSTHIAEKRNNILTFLQFLV